MDKRLYESFVELASRSPIETNACWNCRNGRCYRAMILNDYPTINKDVCSFLTRGSFSCFHDSDSEVWAIQLTEVAKSAFVLLCRDRQMDTALTQILFEFEDSPRTEFNAYAATFAQVAVDVYPCHYLSPRHFRLFSFSKNFLSKKYTIRSYLYSPVNIHISDI